MSIFTAIQVVIFANMSCSTFSYTVRELTILAWINELTDTPEWQCKLDLRPRVCLKFEVYKTFDKSRCGRLGKLDLTLLRLNANMLYDTVSSALMRSKYYIDDFKHTRIIPAIDGVRRLY